MSRIDEALKRAATSAGTSRGAQRTTDSPLRLADEVTLHEYPVEKHAAVSRPDQPHDDAVIAPPPVRRTESRAAVGVPESEKLIAGSAPNEISLEQYRRLAATLHEAQSKKGLKSLMITSAVPKEGKTLTAVNLALTLSESYRRRVLLIDADLRRPSIHEVLRISQQPGLSDLLRSDRLEPTFTAVSSHLSVLPSGPPDQNPVAGLSSKRMRLLLDQFVSTFDWVLLDTPPVGLLSDAQLLGRLAQAAIFVIRAGSTSMATVDKAMGELGRDCIFGAVLNGVEQQAISITDYYRGYSRSVEKAADAL